MRGLDLECGQVNGDAVEAAVDLVEAVTGVTGRARNKHVYQRQHRGLALWCADCHRSGRHGKCDQCGTLIGRMAAVDEPHEVGETCVRGRNRCETVVEANLLANEGRP